MKKSLALILAMLMMLSVLTGCGGNDGKTDGPSDAGSSKTDAPATDSGTPAPEGYHIDGGLRRRRRLRCRHPLPC